MEWSSEFKLPARKPFGSAPIVRFLYYKLRAAMSAQRAASRRDIDCFSSGVLVFMNNHEIIAGLEVEVSLQDSSSMNDVLGVKCLLFRVWIVSG